MQIASSAFENNQVIPKKYTGDGANVNPPLQISGIPSDAQSLVLICDDPDAPGGTFVHWTVWNIEPGVSSIAEGSSPGTQGSNSYGVANYKGPAPPPGSPHRYFFKIYALDTKLNIPAGANVSSLTQAMQGHILAQAQTVGLYGR